MLSVEEMELMAVEIYSQDKGTFESPRIPGPSIRPYAGLVAVQGLSGKRVTLIHYEMSRMGLMLCQAVKILPSFTLW